jgi:tetratricopeptide (TPR) repeat protein
MLSVALTLLVPLSGRCAEDASSSPMERFFAPSRPPVERETADIAGTFDRMKASQRLSGDSVYERREMESPLAPALEDPALPGLKNAVLRNRYAEAYKALAGRLVAQRSAWQGVDLGKRLELVQGFYPALDPGQGQWSRVLAQGILDLLSGRDSHAVLRVSYALSLNPVAPGLKGFLARIEEFTHVKGERIPWGTGLSLLEVKLNECKEAFAAKRLPAVVRLSRDVLVLSPQHPTALSRLGSALFLQGKRKAAASVWKQALALESRPQEREALRYMIEEAAQPPAPPKESQAPAPPPDGQALKRLYKLGLEAYSQGDVDAASERFREMTELDPGNSQAVKALKRMEDERASIGGPAP